MKITRKSVEVDEVIEGSGNVFADLGLQNADQELTQARLTLEIARIIKDKGLTQAKAAKIPGFSNRMFRRSCAIVLARFQISHRSALTNN